MTPPQSCPHGLYGVGSCSDCSVNGDHLHAPTPPEPVASALADGEGLEPYGWIYETFKPGIAWCAPNEWWPAEFTRKAPNPANTRNVISLVTAEAAAARIASLTALNGLLSDKLERRTVALDASEARADRLAKVLGDAIDDLITSLRFRGGGWECTEDELVGQYREALREPKSGGGG